jgi:hypothetical protein
VAIVDGADVMAMQNWDHVKVSRARKRGNEGARKSERGSTESVAVAGIGALAVVVLHSCRCRGRGRGCCRDRCPPLTLASISSSTSTRFQRARTGATSPASSRGISRASECSGTTPFAMDPNVPP